MAVLFVVVLIRQCLKATTQIYYSKTQNECIRDVRVLGFSRALGAQIAYHDRAATGEMVNDLITDTERAMGVVFGVVFSIGSIILLLAYTLIVASFASWSVLAMIAIIFFFGILLRNIFRHSLKTSTAIAGLNRNLSAFLFEKLKSVRLIRLSGAANSETRDFAKLATDLSKRRIQLVTLGAKIPLIVEPLTFFLLMTFLVVGTTLLNLKFELMILVLGLLVRLLPVVQELATTGQGILAAWGSLEAVNNRLLSLGTAREDSGGGRPFETVRRGIEVAEVDFRYDGSDGTTALRNTSFFIPAGSLTAIVGPSGAGKSTLIDLLVKLRKPRSGRILIDDVSIGEFELAKLRRGIAFVPQSPQIINQTIEEHIRYSYPDATDEEVRAAADLSGAAEFVDDLPNRYETMVGEAGIRLSGGQRQRLDLARAVVRPCPVLILDEPASGLDAHSQEHLQQALNRIREQRGTTIILIAHGFSLVMDADQIVVLQDGTVADSGKHHQLMSAKNGWYPQAFAKQFKGAIAANDRSSAL
jgi:ABC-type multidrug transport system fused ATPase/permease subunit